MGINEPTLELTRDRMHTLLKGVVPEFEIDYKAGLVFQINQLKKEKNAVILGHNYMEPALFQTVPDIVGDSLQLSAEAAKSQAERIVFCGVRFMAETAKILNPTRKVLLPAKVAGCSLAASITAADVRRLKAQYPGVPIVTYINTYADVKAEVDYCCTSSNAARIVKSIASDTIIFLPDEYLGRNVAAETGKTVIVPKLDFKDEAKSNPPPKNSMVVWHGKCEVHERFTVDDIRLARAQYPGVVVVSHPECHPDVVLASDYSSSTTKMVEFVRKSTARQFLILTECSMGDNIMAENPDKEVLRICAIRCPHMNEITLEDTLLALQKDQYEITVPEDIRVRAKASLERMLAVQ